MKWNDLGIGIYAILNYARGIVLIEVVEIEKKRYWRYLSECNLHPFASMPPTLCNNKDEPIVRMVNR